MKSGRLVIASNCEGMRTVSKPGLAWEFAAVSAIPADKANAIAAARRQ
ncbi:MAG: hypothetical protein JXR37_02635 [Kiritimatiellae bacterium]|nr:hypothetical protein [Kiritimatiellia bacterium]